MPTAKQIEAKAKKYLKTLEVVYMTSDGIGFDSLEFAKAHAVKNGLQVKEFKKPAKTAKNGTK